MTNKLFKISGSLIALSILTACSAGAGDRLGKAEPEAPEALPIEIPTEQVGYSPIQMPLDMKYGHEQYGREQYGDSLWSQGNGSFFGDNRAANVGDILSINIDISDNAKINNTSSRGQASNEQYGINAFGGLMKALAEALPDLEIDTTKLVDFDNNSNSSNDGSIDRKEDISIKLSAIIVQKLPNGNLVIEGRQEVQVNTEIRELVIVGIVRPIDIRSDNTIDSDRIAGARISYDSRSNARQPYGEQVVDVLLRNSKIEPWLPAQ